MISNDTYQDCTSIDIRLDSLILGNIADSGMITIGCVINTEEPTEILEDNQGAIAMAKNPVGHKRTKHIDIKHHFIRETIQAGTIVLTYCPTKSMVADTFTKALPRDQFKNLRRELGLRSHSY